MERNMGKSTGKNTGRSTNSDYRFVRVVGEGAFSQVYLVEDGKGKRYACKVSRELKMLRREAEILGQLYHPLFPAYVGYEEGEGTGRIFMEYISGRNLGQLARLRGGISSRQAMRIAEELADGMRYLHERQPTILYRDLKPDNIMICEDGHIKIIDLGCACCLDMQGGARVGTPGFAPPEQLDTGQTAGIYSDVYGLGKTIRSVMPQSSGQWTGTGIKRKYGGKHRRRNQGKMFHWDAVPCRPGGGQFYHIKRKQYSEERRCRRRLEHMIEESTREDFRQRPQDMISVSNILAGKRKREEGIICEKNIWESSYKNSCSLPLI